jgi:nucleoside 2-deoxyribosyltransferase
VQIQRIGVLRVYLAGPDVFLPNADSLAAAKKELCVEYGFMGVSPSDNAIDMATLPKRDAGFRISAANEEMIRSCHLVIANLTPLRGPSADVGTAYEMGFARALGLPVFGYTNVAGTLLDRTREQHGVPLQRRASGQMEDAFHMVIEDFDLWDNLMLVGAIHSSGTEVVVNPIPVAYRFTDLAGFETCLQIAAQQLGVRRHTTS